MSYAIKVIRPRHHLIIQYAFNGLTNIEIAQKIGLSTATIGCVLRSPAAQAEMSRLASLSVEKSVDIPARVALHNELVGAATTGLRINKALMQDPFVKAETRSKISQHFMDRVLFNRNDDNDTEHESYRDILRKLDKLQATISPIIPASVESPVLDVEVAEIISMPVSVPGASPKNKENGHTHSNDESLDDQLKYLMGDNSKHVIDLGEDD
mgnify:CR=1 FL=1